MQFVWGISLATSSYYESWFILSTLLSALRWNPKALGGGSESSHVQIHPDPMFEVPLDHPVKTPWGHKRKELPANQQVNHREGLRNLISQVQSGLSLSKTHIHINDWKKIMCNASIQPFLVFILEEWYGGLWRYRFGLELAAISLIAFAGGRSIGCRTTLKARHGSERVNYGQYRQMYLFGSGAIGVMGFHTFLHKLVTNDFLHIGSNTNRFASFSHQTSKNLVLLGKRHQIYLPR